MNAAAIQDQPATGLDRAWAAFYESLALPYRFDVGTLRGSYFYLSYQRCWIRALAAEPTEHDQQEAELLARLSNTDVYLHYGRPAVPDDGQGYRGEKWLAGGGQYDADRYWWCECPVCGMIGIEFEGRSSRLHCGCVRRLDPEDPAVHTSTDRLIAAYRRAQTGSDH